jgi:hypothetical protein
MPAPVRQAAASKRRCLRRGDALPSLPTFCCRTRWAPRRLAKTPCRPWRWRGGVWAVLRRAGRKFQNVARKQHERGLLARCASADRAKNNTPGVLFGSAGSLRERWCEAGDSQVSLQGPVLNSSSCNPVPARRFSGQRTRVAYSERPIEHWGDKLRSQRGRGRTLSAVCRGSRSVDDTVQVRCTKCKGSFRDRARRIQSGYSRQCPNCEVIIFFEEGAIDRNVLHAIRDAKRLRRALRAADEIRSSAPREYVHRR